MPGQVFVQIDPIHTFQQRFQIDEFTPLFGKARHYVVSRRPTVRLDVARCTPDGLELSFSTSMGDDEVECTITLPVDQFHSTDANLDVLAFSDGTYFVVRAGGKEQLAGDSWTLLAASPGAASLAEHEVLYVGQVFGREGSRHVIDRLAEHRTIQRIYADHLTGKYDVFITPLVVQQTFTDVTYGYTQGDELDFGALDALLTPDGLETSKTVVDLVEHALIQYLRPSYNEKLKDWRPRRPTEAMKATRATGLSRLRVVFGVNMTTPAFGSPTVEYSRSHDIPLLMRLPGSANPSGPNVGDFMAEAMRTIARGPVETRFFSADATTMRPDAPGQTVLR